MKKKTRLMAALAFAIVAAGAIAPGGVAAQTAAPAWPVTPRLVAKNWTVPNSPVVGVGEVRFWHDQKYLVIQILPGIDPTGNAMRIKKVQIATANTVDGLKAFLDKKLKPAISLFPYKAYYTPDYGIAAAGHVARFDVDGFGLCWGTLDKCPLDRYAIVHVELEWLVNGVWVEVPEGAYAEGTPMLDVNGKLCAWYAKYPFAKIETGHFVDAKVRGLTFTTATQGGTSSTDGNFFYLPSETVYFSVGSLPLGSAVGDHTVTPMDLFPGSDLDDNRVLNVARVLQTLDTNVNPMLIDVTDSVPCANQALTTLAVTSVDWGDDGAVDALLGAITGACSNLVAVSKDQARLNLDQGQQAANVLKTNVSKNAAMASDKAKIEIVPVYVPALKADGTSTIVVYHDAAGSIIDTRDKAKPLVVTYEEEVEGTASGLDRPNARDIIVAISRDDGSTWKRTNVSKTAGRSSLATTSGTAAPGPGDSNKPALAVKDNMLLLAWTDKYCHGGRPAYAITTAAQRDCDSNGDGTLDGVMKIVHDVPQCVPDYPGDDAYYKDDIWGVGGRQRSVIYDPLDWPDLGDVPYSCVWTARGKIESGGNIVWFKPERITSGRRDATQLVAAAAEDTGVALAWQEDPMGLQPPSEYGPGDGWSGANVSNKTDIWYSFIKWSDFDKVDTAYVPVDGDDIVDQDSELAGRVKALVPFSLPVKITDNDMCSQENILGVAGAGEDAPDIEEQLGTHRYCGTIEGIGTAALPGSNPLCAFTVPVTNHDGVTHNVCVTADATPRVLDGNTGASRVNLFLQPYMKSDGTKSAWVTLAYEESKGMGTPPEVEGEDDDDRYKPDLGKNVIYHSFDYTKPETVSGGGILNMPETDGSGNLVYVVDESGAQVLDPLGRPQLAYENARRVRILQQPKSKAGASKTVLVALWRQGAEGHGKAADIFMRRMALPANDTGNPYAFDHFAPAAQNVSSVKPGEVRTYEVLDESTNNVTTIAKMVNWSWSPTNLSDKSGTEPYSDAKAHRGALNGDELVIAYTWTPNWGRLANDKYDLYVRRSWDGGQNWKTDPNGAGPIEHTIVFVDPVTKVETVTITSYAPGAVEPPRNISNLRNNRISVLEPRVVKTPGTIVKPDGSATGYAEDIQATGIYQVAWGLQVNNPGSLAEDDEEGSPFKIPLDIYYGRTTDKGQHYETVIVTKADGNGTPEEGWNLLAKDQPEQSGAQVKQTPDGSRMYAIWVENGAGTSDIMFRRVDYRK